MKVNTLKIAAILTTGALLSSCDVLKELDYTVTPSPLEMHGDSVRVKIDVKVPPKGIKKKVVAEITPTLGSVTLETIKVAGEKIQIGDKTIPYKAGGKITYDKTYAYDPSFESSELMISLKAYKGAIGTKEKKKEAIDSKKLADGTIITPYLVQPDFKVVELKQTYVQTKDSELRFGNKDIKEIQVKENHDKTTEYLATSALTLNFDKGRSELRSNEINDGDFAALKNWLKLNSNNPKVSIKSITINGFACPDGVESKNDTLSNERVKTAKKLLETIFKDAKYPQINYELATKGLGEDFQGFESKLKESKITSDEQSMVLRIITETSDLDTREKKIKDISKVYNEIEKDIFPKLRRAEIKIVISTTGLTNDELKSIGATNPSSLKLDEQIQAATLTTDAKTKQNIYTSALNSNPNDKLVLNNLGVLMYEQGKYDDAKNYFEKSGKVETTEVSKNNLAAVAGKKGEHDLAKKLLDKNNLTEAKYNSGYYSIKKGKYAEAIVQMKDSKSFNLALAQLLNGKSDDAIKTLDISSAKETAEWYYLKAVANARLNNVDGAISSLKSAITKNPELKTKASKDKEFLSFVSNSSFTSLIK